MPTPMESLVNDPDFATLPPENKRQAIARVDPEGVGKLSPEEQDTFLSKMGHTAAGMVKGIVNPAETGKAVGEEIEQRGFGATVATEGLKLGAAVGTGLALSSPSRMMRYLWAPLLVGGATTAIEQGSRYLSGMKLQGPNDMAVETLASALGQLPFAYAEGRRLRNHEIGTINDALASHERGETPEAKNLAVERASQKAGVAYESGKQQAAGKVIREAPEQAKLPPAEELGRRTKNEVIDLNRRTRNTKNGMYKRALDAARGLVAKDAGPQLAESFRGVLSILRRTSSKQQAILTGPAQNINAISAFEESIDQIQREAAGLKDVPYLTLDRWRGQLQDHAPTEWDAAARSGSLGEGSLQNAFAKLKETMDATVAGTPAEQLLKDADHYFSHEVIRVRDIQNQAVSQVHPDTYLEALINKVNKGDPEAGFLLDRMPKELRDHLRASAMEKMLSNHRLPSGALDIDSFLKTIDDIESRPSTASKVMRMRFGVPGGRVRAAIEALKEARASMRLNENPPELEKAQRTMDAEIQKLGIRKDQLLQQNQATIMHLAKTAGIMAVPYEGLELIRKGHWKTGLGALLMSPLGDAFLARILTSRSSATILSHLNNVADTMANRSILINLGGRLLAHTLEGFYNRTDADEGADDANSGAEDDSAQVNQAPAQ